LATWVQLEIAFFVQQIVKLVTTVVIVYLVKMVNIFQEMFVLALVQQLFSLLIMYVNNASNHNVKLVRYHLLIAKIVMHLIYG